MFFDLKLLDIDNTVERGVAAIARTGATMLTVHAYPQCMRAAVRGAAGSDLCVLGVSVLTSMDDADVRRGRLCPRHSGAGRAAGAAGARRRDRRAGLLAQRGADGALDRRTENGNRHSRHPAGGQRAMGDQKRVIGPAEALDAGASHLVVGRPITAAADPLAAAQAILAEMAGGTRVA